MLSTSIQLIGFALVSFAAYLVAPALGFLAAGLSLLVIGHAADGVTVRLRRKK